jgi:hypothetical protein
VLTVGRGIASISKKRHPNRPERGRTRQDDPRRRGRGACLRRRIAIQSSSEQTRRRAAVAAAERPRRSRLSWAPSRGSEQLSRAEDP